MPITDAPSSVGASAWRWWDVSVLLEPGHLACVCSRPGWRRGPEADLLDILLPEGDDYKLVFISSDSSSKEEDVDDNDSSSTASSFPIDECDWDYFEPGTGARPVINWTSPFG